jgi:hypothetical protein
MLNGFHIEPTNICTLKCPRCSRTKFIEQFPSKWSNQQLNLEHFKQFIDINIKDKTFHLCGDIGDSIYYTDLIPLVTWIKQGGGRVNLSTNGSYKTRKFWQALSALLDYNDTVVFAIDGIPENFTTYRINADWSSIKIGIEETTKTTNTVWQYIPFSYNTNNIDQARTLSQDLGFTEFRVRASSRWDSEDDIYRPGQDFLNPGDNEIKWRKKIVVDEIDPACKTELNQHFINSAGYYTPCCHIATYNFYYKSEFYKNREEYNISKTTILEILEKTKEFYNNLEQTKHTVCTYSCPKI